MNLTNRGTILLTVLMIFIILLPVVTGIVGLDEDNDLLDDDDFSLVSSFVAWARISFRQFLSGLVMGMSVFTLFVVYLGGRSNHRRFNDRTIDAINLFRGIFSATALLRAVFVFLFLALHPDHTNKQFNRNLIPTIIFIPKEVL